MIRLPENTALRAGLLMVLAMGAFVSNDTMVKIVGQSLPVGEIIMIRGAMALLILTVICIRQRVLGSLMELRNGRVLVRTVLDLIATIAFVTALMHMQIANLTAVLQAVPLAVTLLSVIVLRERVGWRRSSAIALGFIGVLLIVKPSPSNFSVYDLLALLIVVAVALRDIFTRLIPVRIPTYVIALANAACVTAGGGALVMVQGFVAPQVWQLGILALAAVFLSSGYLLMVATLRLGELSVTAPFRYSIMVFAIMSGIFVFGEFPDWLAGMGMILIVATGLYAAHREARLRSKARMPTP
jgi:drug/metabolite transporter (DMT)-like permease